MEFFIKGHMLAAAALAFMEAKGDRREAAILAGVTKGGVLAAEYLKAPVAFGARDGWGNPLVAQGVADYVELATQKSLLGRIPFRNAPPNVKLVAAMTAGRAGFVTEGSPKPVTAQGFEALGSMTPEKVVALTVYTDDLVRAGGLPAIQFIADTSAGAVALAEDQALCDPANVGADGAPPWLGANATPIPGTGDLGVDVTTALNQLTSALHAVVIMASKDATTAAALRASSGAALYPDLSPRGGSLLGVPVFTSDAVPLGTVLVCDPTRVVTYAGDLELRYSNQALIALNTTPDDPTGAGTVMTSLWQANLHGLIIEQYVSWLVPSHGAVAAIVDETFPIQAA